MNYLSKMICIFSLSISLNGLQLAKKLHPDTNKDDPQAEKKFQEVSIAYEVDSCCLCFSLYQSQRGLFQIFISQILCCFVVFFLVL